MGIRQEIKSTMKDLCKKAQAPGFMQLTGDETIDAYANLQNLHLLRGMGKGVRNFVSPFVNATVGLPGRIASAFGTGLGRKFTGGTFTDRFREGYETDSLMRAGGRTVKRLLDATQKHHERTIEKGLGPRIGPSGRMTPGWYDYAHAKNNMDSIEGGVAAGTELALAIPFWGKALTSVLSRASRAPAVAKAVGGLSKQNSWRQFAGLGLDAVSSAAHGMKVQADLEDVGREQIDQEARRLNAVAKESERPGPFRM